MCQAQRLNCKAIIRDILERFIIYDSIVLDLEWNQAQTRDREAPGLTFEVIEIGAVRLDEHGNQTDSFSCLIRPVRVHRIVLPRAGSGWH